MDNTKDVDDVYHITFRCGKCNKTQSLEVTFNDGVPILIDCPYCYNVSVIEWSDLPRAKILSVTFVPPELLPPDNHIV